MTKLEERKPSGREKDQAAIDRLAELREKLHSEDVSAARKAAFGLSWMQEDGLDIFVEALFGSFPRTTKQAAAYESTTRQRRPGRKSFPINTHA